MPAYERERIWTGKHPAACTCVDCANRVIVESPPVGPPNHRKTIYCECVMCLERRATSKRKQHRLTSNSRKAPLIIFGVVLFLLGILAYSLGEMAW